MKSRFYVIGINEENLLYYNSEYGGYTSFCTGLERAEKFDTKSDAMETLKKENKFNGINLNVFEVSINMDRVEK